MARNKLKYDALRESLVGDCGKCAGLCCTALYFAKSEGFPKDKAAGVPCVNLAADHTCKVHDGLAQRGLHGCIAYDCFGAGQQTVSVLFEGRSLSDTPAEAEAQFSVFIKVCVLHQMLWYLIEAAAFAPEEAGALIEESRRLTSGSPADVQAFDLENYRERVNALLRRVTEHACVRHEETRDYFGHQFKGASLVRRDLSMALLIAANLSKCDLQGASLLGADMRDANLCGADLSGSLFLTQGQISSAKGDRATRLPPHLSRPAAWDSGKRG